MGELASGSRVKKPLCMGGVCGVVLGCGVERGAGCLGIARVDSVDSMGVDSMETDSISVDFARVGRAGFLEVASARFCAIKYSLLKPSNLAKIASLRAY